MDVLLLEQRPVQAEPVQAELVQTELVQTELVQLSLDQKVPEAAPHGLWLCCSPPPAVLDFAPSFLTTDVPLLVPVCSSFTILKDFFMKVLS